MLDIKVIVSYNLIVLVNKSYSVVVIVVQISQVKCCMSDIVNKLLVGSPRRKASVCKALASKQSINPCLRPRL
jgi:hypothetical protein